MNEITKEIAIQIKKYREHNKLSKKALADIVGAAPSTVSGWENGEYIPSADTLLSLCNLFEITLDEIYGIKQASAQTGEGKYAKIISELDGLSEEQVARVFGYIDRIKEEKKESAKEADKQINSALA